MNLSDLDGDNVWTGTLELQPDAPGRPTMKVIATDGIGDDASSEVLSVTLKINEPASDNRPLVLIGAVVGFIVVLTVVALLAGRRKARLADMDLIESWDAFGSVKQIEATDSTSTISLEGGVVDAASEVQAEDDGVQEEPQPLKGTDLDWDNV
jgi:hypothetical protein